MGKIISIVGNLGSGKTTLTKLLAENSHFIPYWEKPEERPFQTQFTHDFHRWALANQLDFFLFRCNQELSIRQSSEFALIDGGLDQDFNVFTRYIYHNGFLNPAEYKLCENFYQFARELLPPPDLVIRLDVDITTLLQRRFSRGRKIADQDFSIQELTELEQLLDEWLNADISPPVFRLSFTRDINEYKDKIPSLISTILEFLSAE